MKKQYAQSALAALLVASAGAAANAETDLTLARSYELASTTSQYDSLLSESNLADIKVSVHVQARYQFNSRDDGGTTLASSDDDITTGFVLRRTKVGISGNVTDNIKAKIKFAFDRDDGTASLENAYAQWKINDDISLRVGQFKQALLREENLSSSRQLATERSAMNETFNQDFSQGIEAHFGGDSWRGKVGFTDGFGTDSTAFSSSSEADYAFNGRFEFLLGDAEWDQFKQFTSFRGATSGSMLGFAAAYQSAGDTNPSASMTTEMTTATVDYSHVNDGWNFYAAGVYRNMDAPGLDADDYGIVVQGGVFLSDQDELFARWDAVYSDDANAPADEDFNSITVGWNHYLVPESHAAKFTLDVKYYLDETTTSIVKTSDGHNLLADSEDGQFAITAQMQIMF
jgi:phosphate-selective porin OprO and OprP